MSCFIVLLCRQINLNLNLNIASNVKKIAQQISADVCRQKLNQTRHTRTTANRPRSPEIVQRTHRGTVGYLFDLYTASKV